MSIERAKQGILSRFVDAIFPGGINPQSQKALPELSRDNFAIRFNNLNDGLDDLALRPGVLTLGGPGSGKSEFVGRLFRKIFLSRGYGGMVLTVKPGEAKVWIDDAIRFGRSPDIIHVKRDGLPFDPLAYEMRRPGGGNTTNIVDLLTTLCDVGRPHVMSAGDDAARFFKDSNEQAIRAAVNLLKAGGEMPSLLNIRSVVSSLPEMKIPEDQNLFTPEIYEWFKSYSGKLLLTIVERKDAGKIAPNEWRAAEYASDFLCRDWPELAPQTRTSIKQTFASMVDKLIDPPYDIQLGGGQCAYVPEQTYIEGKIIILDLPTTVEGKSAELHQIANKLCYQKAIQRKDKQQYPRQTFLYSDEFQVFCVKQDIDFQEICRENGGCVWYATQNLQNIARRLQEHQPGSGTLGLVGCIGTVICLQNSETEFTNKWCANKFGKHLELIAEMTPQGPVGRPMERWVVDPKEFVRLRTPSPDFPYAVGIIYSNGHVWNQTGEPYLVYAFPRV